MENKVSIIVPIYNQNSEYLERCVSSLLKQTYNNIEILLINDGSKNEYKKSYDKVANKDKRIKIYHKKNTGVSDSRNYGIEKSNGKYITFVDSDDWLEENAIETMVNSLEKNNVDVVRTTYYIAMDNSRIFRKYQIKTGLYNKSDILNSLIPSLINGIENNFVCLLLINKSKINEIVFDTDIGMLEDECFFIKLLLEIDKILLIDIPTYNYYQNEFSVTKSHIYYKRNINDILKANLKLRDILLSKNLKNLIDDVNCSHSIIVLNYVNLIYTINKNRKEFVEYVRNISSIINDNDVLINLNKFNLSFHIKLQLYFIKKCHPYLLLIIFKLKKIKVKKWKQKK